MLILPRRNGTARELPSPTRAKYSRLMTRDISMTFHHIFAPSYISIPTYTLIFPPSRQRRTSKATMKSLLKHLASPSETDLIMDSLGKLRPKPLAPEIGHLRAIKSDSEQKLMRAAADISGRAHAKASYLHTTQSILSLTKNIDNAIHATRVIRSHYSCSL